MRTPWNVQPNITALLIRRAIITCLALAAAFPLAACESTVDIYTWSKEGLLPVSGDDEFGARVGTGLLVFQGDKAWIGSANVALQPLEVPFGDQRWAPHNGSLGMRERFETEVEASSTARRRRRRSTSPRSPD